MLKHRPLWHEARMTVPVTDAEVNPFPAQHEDDSSCSEPSIANAAVS